MEQAILIALLSGALWSMPGALQAAEIPDDGMKPIFAVEPDGPSRDVTGPFVMRAAGEPVSVEYLQDNYYTKTQTEGRLTAYTYDKAKLEERFGD